MITDFLSEPATEGCLGGDVLGVLWPDAERRKA